MKMQEAGFNQNLCSILKERTRSVNNGRNLFVDLGKEIKSHGGGGGKP